MSDWKSINEALKKYTMHLDLEERDVKVLIINDPIGKPILKNTL